MYGYGENEGGCLGWRKGNFLWVLIDSDKCPVTHIGYSSPFPYPWSSEHMLWAGGAQKGGGGFQLGKE